MMLELPMPPPLSACFKNVARNGRAKTDRYKDWEVAAGVALVKAGAFRGMETVTGDVRVHYEFGRPDQRRRDLGNLEKPVSDFLVKHGFLKDDSQIVDLRMTWAGVPGCRVNIEIVRGK